MTCSCPFRSEVLKGLVVEFVLEESVRCCFCQRSKDSVAQVWWYLLSGAREPEAVAAGWFSPANMVKVTAP